jgi:hypothetical protein
MKYRVTATSTMGSESVTWFLTARTKEEGLARARNEASRVFSGSHELNLEAVSRSAEPLVRWGGLVAVVLAAVLPPAVSNWLTVRATIRHEVLQRRQQALFDALRVVDYYNASVSFAGYPALARSKWDIRLARDAMNSMLIYCAKPETTVKVWLNAIQMHHVGDPVRPVTGASINDFRKEVARELGLRVPNLPDPAWIYYAPGTDEDSILRSAISSPVNLAP